MKKKYLVGAYERLSKEDNNTDESSSIESQKIIIESFASFHQMVIAKHYCDDGYTGSNFNRPGFEHLKRDIDCGFINCVIVKDLSRLGRELYETGTYIEEYFLSKNVRFIAINDGYDSEVGDAMLGIRLSVNDLYLRDTSRKIKSSLDAKRKKGDYIGSYAKYGYMKDPQNSKKLIPDPVTAPNVVKMFQLASNGYGSSKIAQQMTREGYPIPSVYKKEHRTNYREVSADHQLGVWRPQTVHNILCDQIYLGHMIQGRWRKMSYHSKKLIRTQEEEWFVVRNTHEALISQELFDRVQKELIKNKKYSVRKKFKYLLQGLLFCKECGHAISICKKAHKQKVSHFGQCNYYLKYSKYHLCSSHYFNYDLFEQEIMKLFKQIGENLEQHINYEKIINESARFLDSDIFILQKKKNQLEKEYIKKTNIVNHLYEDFLDNMLSKEQYKELKTKYDHEVSFLNKQLMEIKEAINQQREVLSAAEYKKQFECFLKFDQLSREMIYQFIDKIELSKDMQVTVYFKTHLAQFLN